MSGTKKTGVKKESGRKRKPETPSSDNISKYFKKRRDDDDKDGVRDEGYQEANDRQR